MAETFIAYMDGIDFQHEKGQPRGGNQIFASPEAVRKHRKCSEECGIVEVEVTLKQWVEPQNLKFHKATSDPAPHANQHVHILHHGLPLCRFSTDVPGEWPFGHSWVPVTDTGYATCTACGKELDAMK